MWFIGNLKRDGDKQWAHLTASDERELARAAERLHAKVRGKGEQRKHLDLTEHQAQLARRYGAREE